LQEVKGRMLKFGLLMLMFIFTFYAFTIRHEAFFACFPFFYLFITLYFPIWKRWLKILASVLLVLFFALLNLGFQASIHTHKLYIAQLVMDYDLAGLSIATNQMLIPYNECVDPDSNTCFADIKARYNRDLIDPLINGLPLNKFNDPKQYHELELAWVTAIFTHPFLYLEDRWLFFKDLLLYRPLFYPYVAPNMFHLSLPNIKVTKFFLRVLDPIAEVFLVLFWVLLNFCILVLLWVRRKELRCDPFYDLWCKNLLFSGLIIWLSHFIVASAPDFRYLYWTTLATLTGLVTIILKLGLFEQDSSHV